MLLILKFSAGVSTTVCIPLTKSDCWYGIFNSNDLLRCNPVQKDVLVGIIPKALGEIPLNKFLSILNFTLFC